MIEPHTDIRRSALAQIRSEAKRIARFVEPERGRVEVVGG